MIVEYWDDARKEIKKEKAKLVSFMSIHVRIDFEEGEGALIPIDDVYVIRAELDYE